MTGFSNERGFVVHQRAYKHTGTRRRKSAGRSQLGIDILASREVERGKVDLYRLVLKKGDVDRAVWGRDGEVGNLIHDIKLASQKPLERECEDYGVREEVASVRVVAVHNGDFDTEVVGPFRQDLEKQLAKANVRLEWWDAERLTDLVCGRGGPTPEIFPPLYRPLVRICLDTLSTRTGAFDFSTVDSLLRRMLSDEQGQALSDRGLAIRLHELALLWDMAAAAVGLPEKGSTLPILEGLERSVLAGLVALRGRNGVKANPLLVPLLQRYLRTAEILADRVARVVGPTYSLALTNTSEAVDYPLRVMKLLGSLAVAGLVAIDIGDNEKAQRLAAVIGDIASSNPAAMGSPPTDDLVIEYWITWEFLLLLGKTDQVGKLAAPVLRELAQRKQYEFPLPAVYHSGTIPMHPETCRDLIAGFVAGDAKAFETGASTLVPIAFLVANAFCPELLSESLKIIVTAEPRCHSQCWIPPVDAPARWYETSISGEGITKVLRFDGDLEAYRAQIAEASRPVNESPAQGLGLSSIDRMAWRRFRTRPPISCVLEALHRASTPPKRRVDEKA